MTAFTCMDMLVSGSADGCWLNDSDFPKKQEAAGIDEW